MCMKYISNFILSSKNDNIKYTQLNEINLDNKQYKYNIIHCNYKSKYTLIPKPNNVCIKINYNSIELTNNIIKFDYISHFLKFSSRTLGIVMFTFINSQNLMEKGDALSIIIVTFTSNNARINFMNDIIKKMQLYKHYDNYDKSVQYYKTFQKIKYK